MARSNDGEQKVDLNSADEDELTSIEGIDGVRARLIVQYRDRHGPFRRWEDVVRVDGIGDTLLEKIREAGQLGGARERSDEQMDLDDLMDALTALAELDAEAVAAYSVAIDSLTDGDDGVASQLAAFRDDHQRHVEDLNERLDALDGDTVDEAAPEDGLLAQLAETAATFGPQAVLLAMIGDEHLTNGAYRTALQLPCDEETHAVIERNYGDEQRHLRWLLETSARRGVEPGARGASPS